MSIVIVSMAQIPKFSRDKWIQSIRRSRGMRSLLVQKDRGPRDGIAARNGFKVKLSISTQQPGFAG
ncbi:hypothetical protein [Sphingobium sp.]|uniref:hypothetical protein n=1 Tax=Sphingobium sp. TaxID=1912891 RepID=UPI003B3A9BFE